MTKGQALREAQDAVGDGQRLLEAWTGRDVDAAPVPERAALAENLGRIGGRLVRAGSEIAAEPFIPVMRKPAPPEWRKLGRKRQIGLVLRTVEAAYGVNNLRRRPVRRPDLVARRQAIFQMFSLVVMSRVAIADEFESCSFYDVTGAIGRGVEALRKGGESAAEIQRIRQSILAAGTMTG